MSTTDKATPRPWRDENSMVLGADGGFVLSRIREEDEYRANAALIVRAVNNHEALVEALQEAVDELQRLDDAWADGGTTTPLPMFREWRSVLASARGEAQETCCQTFRDYGVCEHEPHGAAL